MTLKGIMKLLTNPQVFIKDYRKKYHKHIPNKKSFEKNERYFFDYYQKYKSSKTNVLILESVETLLKHIKWRGLKIKPPNNKLTYAIAINSKDKKDFFKYLILFTKENNITLKYKYNKKTMSLNNIYSFWYAVKNSDTIDLRFSVQKESKAVIYWIKLEFWEEHEEHYMAPVNNHISKKLYKDTAKKFKIFEKKELIDYSIIMNKKHELEYDFDIDLVFTWVNSEDEDWIKMYSNYKPDDFELKTDTANESRFKSRDELKYALRSWEKYGEFIRNIYIVSNCKPPEWLNLDTDKIKWIYHEEILPNEILPTFSSHAIESSLHKIKGLSNYFIYSNDDLFLLKKADKDDFYLSNGIAKVRFEPYGNVNGEIKEGDPDYLNAARNVRNLLEKDFNKTVTHLHTHSFQCMRVDILNEMENRYKEKFEQTRRNKFRQITDISIASFMYPHYSYLTGKAIADNAKTELIIERHNFKKKFKMLLDYNKNGKIGKLPLSLCINDGADSHMNEEWNIEIINFLDTYFPEKSQFEK